MRLSVKQPFIAQRLQIRKKGQQINFENDINPDYLQSYFYRLLSENQFPHCPDSSLFVTLYFYS